MAEVDVLIEAEGWASVSDIEARVISAVEAVFVFTPPTTGDVQSLCVLLTDDAAMKRLNNQFRGQDKPTNVLSFPAGKAAHGFLGDIALGYQVCAREAEGDGKSIANHLSHLVIHGTLHLLGYDHETGADAERMENTERECLARLGIDDPYALEGEAMRESGAIP